jgi:diaminopimelate epimerase
MKLAVYKYHGTGNDFILIDQTRAPCVLNTKTIAFLCDRHFGIGADGLIVIRKKKGWDFAMKYFNSDGKEGTMCGNGGRCAVAFAGTMDRATKEFRFYAIDGGHEAKIKRIRGDTTAVSLRMQDVNGYHRQGDAFLINTGSPHHVRFMENVQDLDVYALGRKVRYSVPFKKEGINVDFAEVWAGGLRVRTYERGVEAETLSCGTGATAATLALAIKNGSLFGKTRVSTRGGVLNVSFKKVKDTFQDIRLEGPAAFVFSGEIDI